MEYVPGASSYSRPMNIENNETVNLPLIRLLLRNNVQRNSQSAHYDILVDPQARYHRPLRDAIGRIQQQNPWMKNLLQTLGRLAYEEERNRHLNQTVNDQNVIPNPNLPGNDNDPRRQEEVHRDPIRHLQNVRNDRVMQQSDTRDRRQRRSPRRVRFNFNDRVQPINTYGSTPANRHHLYTIRTPSTVPGPQMDIPEIMARRALQRYEVRIRMKGSTSNWSLSAKSQFVTHSFLVCPLDTIRSLEIKIEKYLQSMCPLRYEFHQGVAHHFPQEPCRVVNDGFHCCHKQQKLFTLQLDALNGATTLLDYGIGRKATLVSWCPLCFAAQHLDIRTIYGSPPKQSHRRSTAQDSSQMFEALGLAALAFTAYMYIG